MRKEEGQVLVELAAALARVGIGDAESGAKDGLAVPRQHVGEAGAGTDIVEIQLAQAAAASVLAGQLELACDHVEVGPVVVNVIGRSEDLITHSIVQGDAVGDPPGVFGERPHLPDAHAERALQHVAGHPVGGAKRKIG